MPFRIKTDEGGDIHEHIVYNKQEVDELQNSFNIERRFERLMGGDIGRVTMNLQDAQEDIDELNNVKLPDLESRLNDLEGKMSDLESSLTDLGTSLQNLDTYLGDLDSNIDTLDGYFQDPSTIPSSYTFFEGIVTEQAWIDALVANQAWLNELFVNDAYADRITANEIDAGTITSNEINVGELVGSTVFANEFVANEGYVDELIANDVFANKITSNEINVSQLSAITASMGALTVDDVLTIGAGGSLQGSNWLINEDTWTHPTLGGVVWSLANKADFSSGATVTSLSTGTWTTTVSALDGSTDTNQETKQKIQYIAKEGIDELTVAGFIRRDSSGDGSGFSAMVISINGQTAESQDIFSSTFSEVSATVSNLNLTAGNTYVIDIILKASSTADSGQAVTHTTDAHMRDDIVISEGVS